MRRSLNILHTTELYAPSLGGSQEVIRQLSERLAERGHNVTVATTRLPERDYTELNGVVIEEFEISGNRTKGVRGEIERYLERVHRPDIDVLLNYSAQVWPTDLILPNLKDLKARKVLVPLGFSNLFHPDYADYFSRMGQWLKDYDACVYLSHNYRDIDFARSCGASNSIVIPNGASEEEFGRELDLSIKDRLGIPRDHFLIIHVGTHTGLKGHEEAMKIFNQANIGRATLLIIANDQGRGCGTKCRVLKGAFSLDPRPRLSKKALVMTELTREETVAAYKEADLFLFPSNIECSPLVLFEAMASGTPFLTTDVGNASEIIDWTGGGALLPTIKDERGYSHAIIRGSAKLLEELYLDVDRRSRMARNGQEAWRSKFTWEEIAKRYEELYLALVDGTFEQETMDERKIMAR
jgi:L-malate glycosyltransferase